MTSQMSPPPPPPPPPPPMGAVLPRYSYPRANAATVAAAVGRPHPHRRLFLWLGSGVGALIVLVVAVAAVVGPTPPKPCVGAGCVSPPVGHPVTADHRYVSTRYGFEVDYFNSFYSLPPEKVQATDSSLTLSFPQTDDPGTLQFFAEPVSTTSAQDVVAALVSQRWSSATQAFVIPNAEVGYVPGYGAVYDLYPQGGNASAARTRLVIFAAVKNGLAVVAVATGGYVQTTHDTSDGHPSGVDTEVAFDLDPSMNSVRWPGTG